MITSTMEQSKKILKWTAVLILWLVIWQLAAIKTGQEFLIPTPYSALCSLKQLIQIKEFWLSVLWSILRVITGYVLAVTTGILGGILSSRFTIFNEVTSPVLHLIKAVPVASFIILAFFWFKSSDLPIFISFLMVVPMVWNSMYDGLKNIDIKYLELAKIYKISTLKTLLSIKIPFIIPQLLSTALTALGFAWKSSIAAEVICLPFNSLGRMLQNSKLHLETADVFALTAVVAILSLILEYAVKVLIRRFTNVKY